ncbi:MAG: hemerythrin domain-containing protein [Myxococcota bacterium]
MHEQRPDERKLPEDEDTVVPGDLGRERRGSVELFELLHADHEEVTELIDELIGTRPTDLAGREELWEDLFVGLTAHTQAEEEVVYRRLVAALATRHAAEAAIDEHDRIEDLLAEADGMECDDPEFDPTVRRLRAKIADHVRTEEEELLPAARETVTSDELLRLAQRFDGHKRSTELELRSDRQSPLVAAPPTGADELGALPDDVLYRLAQHRRIRGRSRMNRDQLIAALGRAKERSGGPTKP